MICFALVIVLHDYVNNNFVSQSKTNCVLGPV